MKFVHISPQQAINTDKIENIEVTGVEGNVAVEIVTAHDRFIYRRTKSFREAEIRLAELTGMLERD